MDKQAKIIK